MIAFDTTTRKLQAVLAAPEATNKCPWTTSWQDGEGGAVHCNPTTTNGATAVDIVPAPSSLASGSRRLRFASLSNQDTAPITVTVQYVDTGPPSATFILTVVTLAQGETLMYDEGAGWFSTDTTGSLKQVSNATVASQALSTAQAVSSVASRLSVSVSAASVSDSAASVSVSANSVSISAAASQNVNDSMNASLASSAGWSTTLSKTKSSFGF